MCFGVCWQGSARQGSVHCCCLLVGCCCSSLSAAWLGAEIAKAKAIFLSQRARLKHTFSRSLALCTRSLHSQLSTLGQSKLKLQSLCSAPHRLRPSLLARHLRLLRSGSIIATTSARDRNRQRTLLFSSLLPSRSRSRSRFRIARWFAPPRHPHHPLRSISIHRLLRQHPDSQLHSVHTASQRTHPRRRNSYTLKLNPRQVLPALLIRKSCRGPFISSSCFCACTSAHTPLPSRLLACLHPNRIPIALSPTLRRSSHRPLASIIQHPPCRHAITPTTTTLPLVTHYQLHLPSHSTNRNLVQLPFIQFELLCLCLCTSILSTRLGRHPPSHSNLGLRQQRAFVSAAASPPPSPTSTSCLLRNRTTGSTTPATSTSHAPSRLTRVNPPCPQQLPPRWTCCLAWGPPPACTAPSPYHIRSSTMTQALPPFPRPDHPRPHPSTPALARMPPCSMLSPVLRAH